MIGKHIEKSLQERLKQIDWVAFTSIFLIVIFVMTALTVYLFPIYPDEIQVRFWLSRLPYDFPEKISGAPTCISTFFQPIPATMYLPGIIDWLVHGQLENIPSLRQVGFIVAFLWVGGLGVYFNAKVKGNLDKEGSQPSRGLLGLYIAGFFISIFTVGVLPFFLVTNRGEQLILPSVVLLVTIFLISSQKGAHTQRWKSAGLIVLYIVAVSLILYGHPKGLFLTPLCVIIGWQLFRHFRSSLPFIAIMILLTMNIAQEIFAFKYAIRCSELPELEVTLRNYSFDPASLFYDPISFFDKAYHSWLHFPRYLHQLGFNTYTDINYLPAQQLSNTALFVNIFIKLNFAIVFFALMLLLPIRYYRKDVVVGRYVTVNLVLLVLLACALISAIFNLPKHWYDAAYLYSLLLITLIFFVGENFSGVFQKAGPRKLFLYLGAVALLSQSELIIRNLPAFMMGYAGPGVSIAKYDPIKTHYELAMASQACNIDPIKSKRIVVDDYTYLHFQKSKWPMAITYIWLGNDDKSIRQFFSKVDSDGLIVNCSPMLAPYASVVKRAGNVCCISRDDLKNLTYLP